MKNLICVILVVFLPLTLAPQTPRVPVESDIRVPVESQTQHRFEVYVSVGGDNETITTLITSHLKRELRALGDVDIVGKDDGWGYALRVRYIEHERGGVKTGDLSIAYIREMRLGKFYFKDDSRHTMAVFPGNLGIAVWTKDNLQELCISVAGYFNDTYLESYRSALRLRD